MEKPMLQIGDLVRVLKSGEVLVYLGRDGDCYQFWHHKWEMCWFSHDTFPPDKWEVIG
tara:strand:+ start:1293 stop:1466 length:174 start_codon:yes stop_codon:yes gene_type:complete